MIGENELPDDLTNLTTPQLDEQHFASIDRERLRPTIVRTHPPRILILYGSLRVRSFSRLSAEEAGRILTRLGAEVRFFHPSGLPLVDDGVDASHPKVRELRDLVAWSEGMVWLSPERHGAMTGLMKTQIDWIPLSEGAVRPTQGKTLAVMQVSGGSQNFNAVNQMRLLGRWMRMGREIELVQRRTYQEITGLLLERSVDAAWLCGYPYLQHADLLDLVAAPVWRGGPRYQSYLIVGAEDGAEALSDLQGGTHAFSDPDSNSGYLVTATDLRRMGEQVEGFFSRSIFTFGHRNVVRAVADGEHPPERGHRSRSEGSAPDHNRGGHDGPLYRDPHPNRRICSGDAERAAAYGVQPGS